MAKSTFDLASGKKKDKKKEEIAKRHRKKELPKKYHSATPKAKELYSFGIASCALANLAKQRGVEHIGLRTIDAAAEYLVDFARAMVYDAVRNAEYCDKKTINQEHVREAIRTSRKRLGLHASHLVGL